MDRGKRTLTATRRDFLKLAGLATAGAPIRAQQMQMPSVPLPAAAPEITGAEFTLEIAPITVELAPNRILSTIGYNGTSPGPRLPEPGAMPGTTVATSC